MQTKHRHDGTSPLPLGMDWTPPPRFWAGRETVWPQDPRSGWSYCVTIPSWNVLAKSRDSEPTVFYRVQVGLQSPEGITTTRTVLRRFNDFLKLQAALKRLFPRKNHPPAPPKGLLRLKTRAMLEERRSTLEEWMTKLLSDIDISRSVVVASFLELESAARSSFQEDGQPSQDPLVSANTSGSSHNFHPTSSIPLPDGSPSLMSDYGSDVAYETSEIGTSSLGRDNSSEIGLEDPSLEEDLSSPIDKFVKYGMSNIDEGLSMGHAILEQLESLPKHKMHAREFHNNLEHSTSNGSSLKTSPHATDMVHHVRKLSNESIGSDRSSQRGNELSNSAYSHSNGYGNLDSRTAEGSDYQISDNVKLIVPQDQRQKMNRLLTTMERRLITAKTDMEDLMSRLNQEVAVKDYLATKVKDLEVELETTKQKSKENLEQAILIERERVTQMQWDMEELRRKSMEMELKLLNSQQVQSTSEFTNSPTNQEKHVLQQHELDSVKKQFEDLSKRYQQLEVKSKADIKILVKEVKSLRGSQGELKQHLNQSLEEKSKTEELLQEERKRNAETRTSLRKLFSRCKSVYDGLQECNVTHLLQEQRDDLPVNIPSSNLLELVATSDNQIGLLLAEVHHLDQDVDSASTSDPVTAVDDEYTLDKELKHMLSSILIDSGVLRKQVNALIVRALEKNISLEKVDTKPGSNVNEPSEL